MIDICLAFASKEAAIKGLTALGFIAVTEKGEIQGIAGAEVDWTPIAVEITPPVRDEKTGEEIAPAEIDPRYFVNVRLSGALAASQRQGKPTTVKDGQGKDMAASVCEATAVGAQFEVGETKDDFVRSKVITLDDVECELIDATSWPSGPPRVWQ